MSRAPHRQGTAETYRYPPAAVVSDCSSAAVGSSEFRTSRPTAAAGGARLLLPSRSEVPRTLGISDEIWISAAHDVKMGKRSTRDAARFYGFHHTSRHQSERIPLSLPESRLLFSPADEAEVLEILREERLHEIPITTDNIRFIVRAIASHGGQQLLPLEFPTPRWIHEFKFAHGLINNTATTHTAGTSPQGVHSGSIVSTYSLDACHHTHPQAHTGDQETKFPRSIVTMSHSSREAFTTRHANTYDPSDAGHTTSSSSNGSSALVESSQRAYRPSHTVPHATWSKAIAAVEQHGMSLRNAATLHGVHFGALYRRIKKRAHSDVQGYLEAGDEARIVRVVVARAELGVLMTFAELMDLAQRTALRNVPDVTVEAARALMSRFQARNEHSIRHIIVGWPPPPTPLPTRTSRGSSTQSVWSQDTVSTPSSSRDALD